MSAAHEGNPKNELARGFFQDSLLQLLLAFDAMPRPWDGFQSLRVDFFPTVNALAKVAFADARERAFHHLQKLEGALSRIREGNFGECIHCGKEINPKRLEAVPWTRHCIECQEKLEQGILEEAPRYLVFRVSLVRRRHRPAAYVL